MKRPPKIKSIFGLIIVLMLLIYMIFGKHGVYFWSAYYYIVIDLIVLWLCYIGLIMTDKLIRLTIYCLSVIFFICFVLDLYSFFDIFVFRVINNSYLIGGLVLISVISTISYGMVKRKI